MKKIIDPGHVYELLSLDGDFRQTLTFVKRVDLENPERFPGNANAHPGTTIQSVVRCLVERIEYLHQQIPHRNNLTIRDRLLEILWLLEERAAERHGYPFVMGHEEMATAPMCEHCGHVVCEKLVKLLDASANPR